MHGKDNMRSGGEILVDQLVIHGVRHAFCVPGESYLAALDALLRPRRSRSPSAATRAAPRRWPPKPGQAHRPPRHRHGDARAGRHQRLRRHPCRRQDSTPMIVFVGQVARSMRGREAFQEIDYRAVFGTDRQVGRRDRRRRRASRRSSRAPSPRPLPAGPARWCSHCRRTCCARRAAVADATAFEPSRPSPGLTDMAQLQKMLWAAKQPFVIVGGSRWSRSGGRRARAFRRAFRACRSATTFRRQALFDNRCIPLRRRFGLGINPKLLARIKGCRPGAADRRPHQRDAVAELHADRYSRAAADAGPRPSRRRGTRPRLSPALSPSTRSPTAFCRGARGPAAAATIFPGRARSHRPRRLSRLDRRRAAAGRGQLGEIVVWLRDSLPDDAIITNGAGNYTGWLHRFSAPADYGTQARRRPPAPWATASRRRSPPSSHYPERMVVCLPATATSR